MFEGEARKKRAAKGKKKNKKCEAGQLKRKIRMTKRRVGGWVEKKKTLL